MDELRAQGFSSRENRGGCQPASAGCGRKPRAGSVRSVTANMVWPVFREFAEAGSLTPAGPNQKWVGDITYLRTGEGWLYSGRGYRSAVAVSHWLSMFAMTKHSLPAMQVTDGAVAA